MQINEQKEQEDEIKSHKQIARDIKKVVHKKFYDIFQIPLLHFVAFCSYLLLLLQLRNSFGS
jgi:hypothetical protein